MTILEKKANEYAQTLYPIDIDEVSVIVRDFCAGYNEAEERHTEELQELRDKAIEAHRQCCKYKEDWFCSDLDNRTESVECDSNCQYIKLFSQNLTK